MISVIFYIKNIDSRKIANRIMDNWSKHFEKQLHLNNSESSTSTPSTVEEPDKIPIQTNIAPRGVEKVDRHSDSIASLDKGKRSKIVENPVKVSSAPIATEKRKKRPEPPSDTLTKSNDESTKLTDSLKKDLLKNVKIEPSESVDNTNTKIQDTVESAHNTKKRNSIDRSDSPMDLLTNKLKNTAPVKKKVKLTKLTPSANNRPESVNSTNVSSPSKGKAANEAISISTLPKFKKVVDIVSDFKPPDNNQEDYTLPVSPTITSYRKPISEVVSSESVPLKSKRISWRPILTDVKIFYPHPKINNVIIF
jgi:hypothetical protein